MSDSGICAGLEWERENFDERMPDCHTASVLTESVYENLDTGAAIVFSSPLQRAIERELKSDGDLAKELQDLEDYERIPKSQTLA